jgi:CRISPR/Cas system CMR subunit Cmr4 (Cas7 group RAMP superfamily)
MEAKLSDFQTEQDEVSTRLFLRVDTPVFLGTPQKIADETVVFLERDGKKNGNGLPTFSCDILRSGLRKIAFDIKGREELFQTKTDKENSAEIFQNATLLPLFFPVHFLPGGFGWVTCPSVLRRAFSPEFEKSELLSGILSSEETNTQEGISLPAAFPEQNLTSVLVHGFSLQAKYGDTEGHLRSLIAKIFPHSAWFGTTIRSNLAIVSEETWQYLWESVSEWHSFAELDAITKTPTDLRSTQRECIRAESIFFADVNQQEEVLAVLRQPVFSHVQCGAGRSSGFGICEISLLEERNDSN